MAPFSSEPRVVKIQPADHGADVKGRLDRIELELCSGDPCAVGNNGSRDNWTQELGAGWITKGLQTTAKRIDQAVARSIIRLLRPDFIIAHITGNIDKDLIRGRPDVRDV